MHGHGPEHVQCAGGRRVRERRPVQQRDHPRLLGGDQRARRSARRARPFRGPTGRVAPSPRGGYLDLHNFRNRDWKPGQLAAGIEPFRRIYDLRHTFATPALRAGISTFDLSRYMGASLTMIDRHYGHLARDGREHAIRLLDTLHAGAVDVRGRSVDAEATTSRRNRRQEGSLSRQ
jgi:integrase